MIGCLDFALRERFIFVADKREIHNMSIEIKKLSINDREDIYQMLQSIPSNENGFINSVNGKSYQEYKEWLIGALENSLQEGVIDGWRVPQTTYWLYEDGKPVGYGKIRHFLTDKLLADGGNVGYAIIPSARKKGLGKTFLKLLIVESELLGVERVLLTIKKENKASLAVALANGGIVEKVEAGKYYIWIDKK